MKTHLLKTKSFAVFLLVIFAATSCNQNSPEGGTSNEKKKGTQITYTDEVDSYSSGEFPYNGELTDGQIMGYYNMALSTYGDRGLYHYVTFSDAKTEAQIKAIAKEFGEKADKMVRSQHEIPDDVWAGYTKLKFHVNYVYDGKVVTVATYDYLK